MEAGFDRISEFSEFRYGNDPEIHLSDLASLRTPFMEKKQIIKNLCLL
jgi:hypothetical protein